VAKEPDHDSKSLTDKGETKKQRNTKVLERKNIDGSVTSAAMIEEKAIEEKAALENKAAWQFCLCLQKRGVLAKPTHGNIIRFSPPLIIEESDLMRAVTIIVDTLDSF